MTDEYDYIARWSFDSGHIAHYKQGENFDISTSATGGRNLAKILLKMENIQVNEVCKIPIPPQIGVVEYEDIGDADDLTLSGYPA